MFKANCYNFNHARSPCQVQTLRFDLRDFDIEDCWVNSVDNSQNLDHAQNQVFLEYVTHTLRKIARSKESKSCMILPKCFSSNTA
jgi:hypothetical protein